MLHEGKLSDDVLLRHRSNNEEHSVVLNDELVVLLVPIGLVEEFAVSVASLEDVVGVVLPAWS